MKVTLQEMRQHDVALVKPWLIAEENAKWLSPFFQQAPISDLQLAVFLIKRDKLTFLIMCDSTPVGIMGLTNIDHLNHSSEVWSVVGDKRFRGRGVSTLGFILTLQRAFFNLKMHSVTAWATDGNHSTHILRKVGFTCIGRQRQCHLQDGEFKDRLLFDILYGEFASSQFAKIQDHGVI